LLTAARAGDLEALGRALEDYREDLRHVADAALGGDIEAKVGASDLVQETFVTAQRDFHQFRGSDATTFRGWLKAILRHRLADVTGRFRKTHMRRLDRECSLDAASPRAAQARNRPDSTTSPSRRMIQTEEKANLREALHHLPARYRDVMILRYWERLEFEAIGSRLGISGEAARKIWGRALIKLRENVGASHDSR